MVHGISGESKNKVDFYYKRCLEGSPDESVLLREAENDPAYDENDVPTISLDSHMNIRLHTGARLNVVLLTYLLIPM